VPVSHSYAASKPASESIYRADVVPIGEDDRYV